MIGRIGVVVLSSVLGSGCEVGDPRAFDRGPGPGDEPLPSVILSGTTADYFTGEPVGGVSLETLGLAPEQLSASSEPDADFELEVPIASYFFLRTAATGLYRPTLSQIDGFVEPTTVELPVVSQADIARQHATAGVAALPDTTTVIVELRADGGGTLEAFARENLAIIDASGTVIAAEPLVVGPLGDVDPALAESAPGGLAKFVFLNVPSGTHELSVTCADCQPAFASGQTLIASAGVTLARTTLGSPQGPPPGSFASIMPLFARGGDGGLGCANCHNAGGQQPVLDGDADAVRDALLAAPGVVDTADPDASLLLSKPLYEVPANHPNATFLSADDKSYQAIRAWIEAGAE